MYRISQIIISAIAIVFVLALSVLVLMLTLMGRAPGSSLTKSSTSSEISTSKRQYVCPLTPAALNTWKTFSSDNGYTIKYPPGWSFGNCFSGKQVNFVYRPAQFTCNGFEGLGPFLIIGPIINLQNNVSPHTLIDSYNQYGLLVGQYTNPDQTIMDDIVVTPAGNIYDLTYPLNATDTQVSECMTRSFRVRE